MLVIRFSRRGKKKQPTYRIIISEKSKDPWGDFLEDLGFYNPRSKETVLKRDRIKYWLSKGAQLSATVHNLLVSQGLIKGPKVKATKMKKRKSKEEKHPEEKFPKEEKIEEKQKEIESEKKEFNTSEEKQEERRI
jgi:small subunit ribosomal protein S16